MASRASNFCIDSHDPYAQIRWWARRDLVNDLRDGEKGWAVLADPEGNEFCVLRQYTGSGS